MTDSSLPEDDPRIASRANLLDEELDAGSDDPAAQARVILEDSEARTLDRGAALGTSIERRSSQDTIDVLDPLPTYDPERDGAEKAGLEAGSGRDGADET